jgi:hypothetical protein
LLEHLTRLLIARTVAGENGDRGTGFGERLGDFQAETTIAPRDNRNLTIESKLIENRR